MRRTFMLFATAFVSASSIASAQPKVEPMIGFGIVSPRDLGLHAFGAINLAPQRALHPRADLVLERTDDSELLFLASLVYAPSKKPVSPYLIAGVGSYFMNGDGLAAAAGVGVRMASVWSAPLIVETRLANHRDPHLIVTLAVRP